MFVDKAADTHIGNWIRTVMTVMEHTAPELPK